MLTYTISLSGANEVPANASTATGSATVTINQTTGAVTVNGTFAGMTPTIGHIHAAAAVGATASPITPSFAFTATTFSYSGTLTPTQVTDVASGMAYVNLHSAAPYMAGEIRGQIQ